MPAYYLTSQALEELKKELHELKTTGRQEIAERLRESKDLGDLSENAEYQDAKETQAQLESKIEKLEDMIKHATIIKKGNGHSRVDLGSTIKVKSLSQSKNHKVLSIVGSLEAKPEEGKISNESPLGKAFLGVKKDDIVVVKTPNGEVKYKVEEIL